MCSIYGCDNKLLANGFCRKHYLRWYRYGDPQIVHLIKDGRKKHPLWKTWHEMKLRCNWPEHKFYYRYGGRGIKVCDSWQNDFWLFVKDVGEKPIGTSLDRINNDGDYEPGNVRWATQKIQSHNSSCFKKTDELIKKVLSYQRKSKNGRGQGFTYAEIADMVGGVSEWLVGEIFRTHEKVQGVASK